MVLPFPNEIWLDIFKGLANEGEYDVLERCRVVDDSGGKLRRWSGPTDVSIVGGNSKDGRRPIPHLATFASRFAGRWTRVRNLLIHSAVWRARDLDLDTIVRDLAAFAITHLCLRDVTFPSILTLGRLASPWSAVRRLTLGHVTFPSVTTFARLLSCVFVKHGFDLRSVPVYPGLPSHLADVDLGNNLHSDPCSVADLVDLFIATGLSANLRRITASSPWVTTVCDATLNRLVKHSHSLHHLSLGQSSFGHAFLFQSICIARYFHVSSNTYLEHLRLTVDVDRENKSYLYVSVVATLSQVTSTHISRIKVDFWPYDILGAKLDVDLEKLMDGLPQLDAIFFQPIFNSLADVDIFITALDRQEVRDKESVQDLRLYLPMLDARGILGCVSFHVVRFAIRIAMSGVHLTREWRTRRIKSVSAEDAEVSHAGAGADDDRRTNNAISVTIPHDDSDVVSETSQPVWVPPAVYDDAETHSSSKPKVAQVPADSACDDEVVLQNTTAGPETSVETFARDDHGTCASKCMSAGE
ncbi:hypothetical protein IEO21_04518 [Rhodonia placenta]|uniref:Uncharacterized protein n=1 Tax=Rhodonia placenta TaxID=104341 RepID=A0A8H7U370_9APHY|nr:hypothetical protein IEO21_04518 [Postia placenta]